MDTAGSRRTVQLPRLPRGCWLPPKSVAHGNTTDYIGIHEPNGGAFVGTTTSGRRLHKLTAVKVQKLKVSKAKYFGDGGGLWLQVSPTLTRSWVFRYTLAGKAREMGLGPLHTVGLADAREQALACRRLLLDGVDPIAARNAAKRTAVAAAARALTFDECAEQYIEAHRAGWRNELHAKQWQDTLRQHAAPIFGKLDVAMVDTALVLKALQPIWTTRTETAKRLRGRIENVLGWATARGYRTGDNPARWRDHLDQLLAAPTKIAPVVHHPALPYARMNAFMVAVRAEHSTAARAVELIALTAARTGEVFLADWAEFDLEGKTWTVPAERMKAGEEHRAPLSPPALRLLEKMRKQTGGKGLVFPRSDEDDTKPLSNMAGMFLLRRLGYGEFTVHGFRSSFRQWAAECTSVPPEVAEAALAHKLKDKTIAAYQRSDLFAKRAGLMNAWASYCGRPATTTATVTPIGARRTR
jgi:integrase